MKTSNNRRDFLKKMGIASIPLLAPEFVFGSTAQSNKAIINNDGTLAINFFFDGMGYALSPTAYLNKLLDINQETRIRFDFYGDGGDIEKLEKKFAEISGKEAAIYLPTGTMANQLAIKLLSEENTKVIVPENSHIYRDEADAAQSVHNKRLIPIGKGKHTYNLSDLKKELSYLDQGEVFKSGLGTVVIENPVRRADGRFVPLKDIEEVSDYCKTKGYKMHLDGARIHIASAYSGVSIKTYASYFDTVYFSLYKYLNASGGAILCGDKDLIDKLKHQIKIYGGTVFQNWHIGSMALHHLEKTEQTWQEVKKNVAILQSEMNKIDGVQLEHFTNGTNVYHFTFRDRNSTQKFVDTLDKQNMLMSNPNEKGVVALHFNESLLQKDIQEVIQTWKNALKA